MTAWVFETRRCPTLLNEIKKTKRDSNPDLQACAVITFFLAATHCLKIYVADDVTLAI